MTRPPVRWAHSDLPEELSRLIASTAPSQQDAAAMARMRERLHEALGQSFESKLSGAKPASHVLSLLQRGKWLCAAALATAGLSFISVQSLQTRAIARPTSVQPLAAEVASPATVGASRPPLAAGASVQLASASQQPFTQRNAEAQPVSDAPRAPVERAGAAAVGDGAERGQGSARAQHSARASASRNPAHPEPLAKASAGAGRGRSSARPPELAKASASRNSSAKAANSGEAAPTGLAAELRGLAEIRKVLHSSPARALALVETQERQFAQGALFPERELLRIETLIRAGRADEAKRRATRALSASNNPPYRERIEKLFAQTAAPRLAADGVAKGVTPE